MNNALIFRFTRTSRARVGYVSPVLVIVLNL